MRSGFAPHAHHAHAHALHGVWLVRRSHLHATTLHAQIAAYDAAEHGWPVPALQVILDEIVATYREDTNLAGSMEEALHAGHHDVATAIWEAIIQGRTEPERWGLEGCAVGCLGAVLLLVGAVPLLAVLLVCYLLITDTPIPAAASLRFASLLVRLAAEGDYSRALWIADAAPPVMVRIGTQPAAAAGERGHARVARLMQERAGCALPGGRAIAARGRLATAVRAGDIEAVKLLLTEITLGPDSLRGDLVYGAAAAGNLEMVQLLLERLGPWAGEVAHVVLTLVQHGHWQLVPKLHAAATGALRGQLLRACSDVCGSYLHPHAGLMLWVLETTTNPSALDLMLFDYVNAWKASSSTNYLGVRVRPHPEVVLAFSPVAPIWTELFGALAEWGEAGAGEGDGGRRSQQRGGEGGGGAAAASSSSTLRGISGRTGANARAGGGRGTTRNGTNSSSRQQQQQLPRGAVRFTRRMMEWLVQTGDVDLLYQALLLLDRHGAQLQVYNVL